MEAVEILIERADGSSERRPLADGVYDIGRESGDIVLGDPNSSNGHASLHIKNGEVSVTDNQSTNGTFDFSGQRLSGAYVVSETQGVRIGNASIRVAPKVAAQRGGTHVMQAVPEFLPNAASPTVATSAATPTAKRPATVLKAPDQTPGILLVDGQQKSFSLEGVWRVAAAPAAGMSVQVELDASGSPAVIVATDPTALIREQGRQAMNLAQSGFAVAIERMGKVPFITAVILALGWFVVPAVSFGPVLSLTFWDLSNANLGEPFALLRGKGSVGLLGLLGLVAVFTPFAQLHKPHLRVLNLAPAAFLGLWLVRQTIGVGAAIIEAQQKQAQASRALEGLFGGAGGAGAKAEDDSLFDSLGGMFADMLWEQVSFGLGLWIVFIASAVLFAQMFTRVKAGQTVS